MTKQEDFRYTFKTAKTPIEVFELLLNIEHWWSGLYEETIKGKSRELNDEFSFNAGGGLHYSVQKLVELVPGKRIAWQVTDSKLSFLSHVAEWNGTTICFDISGGTDGTHITFTHKGLVPRTECYANCSAAWTGYLDNLKKKLGG